MFLLVHLFLFGPSLPPQENRHSSSAALGATSIERHITLDRAMYGSDQAASLEITGLNRLTSYVRDIETSLGSPIKKIQPSEVPAMKKLRKH